jgi:hypothetical protein
VSETLEHTARRIAEHGRDALLARLRPAFEEAAAAHRDALKLDDDQLEQMVQRAADRADGLQWRRALASVATEQLGIGLGEALSHPAVARAQAIVGAPSYEDALGALGTERPAATADEADTAAEATEAEGRDGEPEHDKDEISEQQPEAGKPDPDANDEDPEASEDEPEADKDKPESDKDKDEPEADEADAPEPRPAAADSKPVAAPETAPHAVPGGGPALEPGEPEAVRLRAVHLGGIANLAPAEGDLELHISTLGLDIVRNPDQVVLGRLTWDEIVALETPEVGGRFRRRHAPDAHLVIRSPQGSASFEIPGVTTEELREHLAPLLARR